MPRPALGGVSAPLSVVAGLTGAKETFEGCCCCCCCGGDAGEPRSGVGAMGFHPPFPNPLSPWPWPWPWRREEGWSS
jgi:hypothetical protein